MHELFTTAIVQNGQVGEALKILQGLCGMTPVRQLERRLIFEGPTAPPLVPIGKALLQSRKQVNILQWRELNDQLVRQSYYLTISYDMDETNFANAEASDMNLDELRGTVLFFDNPDPPGIRPVNSRLAIQIRDEPHLPAFLGQINYRYASEHIRVAHYAYRENVIFCLSSDLQWPKKNDNGTGPTASHAIPTSLPPFEELLPFDAENKWIFTASVHVSDGNQPLLMQKGLDQLAQVKHEFAGTFDFVLVPRRQLDTRVQSYNQSMRA